MNGWRGWAEIRRIVRPRPQLEDDVEAELSFHLEGRIDELEADGWSREEARHEVIRHFGNPGTIGRECREISDRRISEERRVERMGIVRQDVRYALRSLRRNPGFAAVTVLTLALGVGATTAIFSVVDAVIFRPLPYHDPGRPVTIYERQLAQGVPRDQPSPPNFSDWHERNRAFAGMVAIAHESATLSNVEQPEVMALASVSWDLLPVLGVEPAFGRTFSADEGVAGGPPTDWGEPGQHHRQSRFLFVLGRLKDDVTMEAAQGT
ncbi:MAG: ABC transporter permease [Gemmatimonadetes bacterium]|nr:ABC transporter permease [Gemmatimonadota bacterium]